MNSYKPPHMTVVSPYLIVQDAKETLEFYEKAFGFKVEEKMEEKGQIVHAHMKHKEGSILFGPEGLYDTTHKSPKSLGFPASVSLYLYCEDVDALYAQAMKAGAVSLMEPQDSFWGDRICKVADPNGHEFMFATLLGEGNKE